MTTAAAGGTACNEDQANKNGKAPGMGGGGAAPASLAVWFGSYRFFMAQRTWRAASGYPLAARNFTTLRSAERRKTGRAWRSMAWRGRIVSRHGEQAKSNASKNEKKYRQQSWRMTKNGGIMRIGLSERR
jgi:hypothetical protein